MISTHEAIEFVLAKIVDEAGRRNASLSEIDREVRCLERDR
jgi:hypothetical protein